MIKRPITLSDIIIGEPLSWDVFDLQGNLLLKKNLVVTSFKQVEVLVERGMFIDAQAAHEQTEVESPPEKPSVVRMINQTDKRLEKLLFGMLHKVEEPDMPGKILEVAKAIYDATNLNKDIALACVLLNQTANDYPVRHSIDTAIVSILVAQAMHKAPEEIIPIVAAAATMNVGMLLRHQKLHDKLEPLSPEEAELIKKHPQAGADILKQAGVTDADWLSYVLLHHENEDGSGYPFGKKGVEVPQNAKIISLADRYCARVSARSYRKPVLPNAALRDIFLEGGKAIDPMLAAYFIKVLGIYPPGTYVRLQSGEIGVVTHKGETATTPIVHALVGPRGAPLSFPIKRATDNTMYSIRETLSEEQAAIRFRMQQLWGEEASV